MNKLLSKCRIIYSCLYLLICPILCFVLMEAYTHNPFRTMKTVPVLMNIALFELIALFLLALTSNIRAALIIEILFSAVYGLINYFVLEFRGVPIQPWDLLSLSTAASVADNYDYHPDKSALLVLAGFALLLLLSGFTKLRLCGLYRRLCVLLLSGLCLFGYTRMLHNETIVETKLKLYNKLFTPTAVQYKNGTLTAFLMELQYMAVEKPSGYDADAAETMLKTYVSDNTKTDTRYPNIIVIMNEAFSDPAVLGSFETDKDYMPFVRSMLAGKENTISGCLNVSVKGGNTANTEFEYLTGSTMAFLPFGSVPYQQYVRSKLPTLASALSDLGYHTVAMHPYGASGWERDTVYPAFGFDQSLFIDFYRDSPRIRKYVSDEGNYEKIIRIFEGKEPEQPLFIFNVTMQNHSSYADWADYDNFTPHITVADSSSKLLPAYLSLIHLSDQAIEKLVAYFAAQSEETVVVFFGDHQPADSVVNPVLALHDKSCQTLTEGEERNRFKVPFFIWANFDIKEESGIETSANYLGVKTLQAAGISLPDYFAFLSEQQSLVPVISAAGVMLSDGTLTHISDQKALLKPYRILQYYQLFDRQDRE